MKVHDLKCWPNPFHAVLKGTKVHEIRVDDRSFKHGDFLLLREYVPEMAKFTGRKIAALVMHVTRGGEWGLPSDLCVMSLKVMATHEAAHRSADDDPIINWLIDLLSKAGG